LNNKLKFSEVIFLERITADLVERVFEERRRIEENAHLIDDLELYLRALPYYKQRPEGGTTEEKPWTRDIILHNATVFVDSAYNMCHQGDVTVETLRGIKKRIGDHKVFIFWEHNRYKPICGPFDLTVLRQDAGIARPFGDEKMILEMADIVLEGEECIIKEPALKKNCKRAGFKVSVRCEF